MTEGNTEDKLYFMFGLQRTAVEFGLRRTVVERPFMVKALQPNTILAYCWALLEGPNLKQCLKQAHPDSQGQSVCK